MFYNCLLTDLFFLSALLHNILFYSLQISGQARLHPVAFTEIKSRLLGLRVNKSMKMARPVMGFTASWTAVSQMTTVYSLKSMMYPFTSASTKYFSPDFVGLSLIYCLIPSLAFVATILSSTEIFCLG